MRCLIGVGVGLVAVGCSTAGSSANKVPATSGNSTATATRSPAPQPRPALRPLNVESLPVPVDYVCSAGLYFRSPANRAVGDCLPYAYLVGGVKSKPNNRTACPAGSFMSMGPVECTDDDGIVTPVTPGPHTCSRPGGPCPSSRSPLPPHTSVIAWSAIAFPSGHCTAGYYFGETNGDAACVPADYLPGGIPGHRNHNTACPLGSALRPGKLTGTLCTESAPPYDIVAPVTPSAA